jgi:hypothetical protein
MPVAICINMIWKPVHAPKYLSFSGQQSQQNPGFWIGVDGLGTV